MSDQQHESFDLEVVLSGFSWLLGSNYKMILLVEVSKVDKFVVEGLKLDKFKSYGLKTDLILYKKKCICIISSATDYNAKMDKYRKNTTESSKKICHFARSRKNFIEKSTMEIQRKNINTFNKLNKRWQGGPMGGHLRVGPVGLWHTLSHRAQRWARSKPSPVVVSNYRGSRWMRSTPKNVHAP